MSVRRIFWISLCAIVVIVFYAMIPVDTYEQHDMLYSFIGGVILFGTLFMALGDFGSIYELTDKPDPDEPEVPYRKLAPFSAIPAFIFIIVLVIHQGNRKKEELTRYGVLTKGTVVGGVATTTTRRFQKNTTYELQVTYYDSLQQPHTFQASVSGSEFNNSGKGDVVDVIYSRRHPSLANALMDLKEVEKYIKIPNAPLTVEHLLSILDGTIKNDSILHYLNTINYEWTADGDVYANNRRNIAIKVFPGNEELAYLEKKNMFIVQENSFEGDLTKHGFKKKASTTDGESQELYYNDNYIITKERKNVERDNNSSNMLDASVLEIFHIVKASSLAEE